jgi:hypothetical protein
VSDERVGRGLWPVASRPPDVHQGL